MFFRKIKTKEANSGGRLAARLSKASALAAGSLIVGAPAFAVCGSLSPTEAECTGSNPGTTVNFSGAGARTLTIAQGADINSGGNTVTVSASGGNGTVANNGSVATNSSNGSTNYSAIFVGSNTGVASVVNTGDVDAAGTNATGVRFVAQSGAASLDNSGTIVAAGTASSGQFGPMGALISAISSDVSVTNSGSITNGTSGAGLGMLIDHSGTGETVVANDAGAIIQGVNTGILIRNALGPVQITNDGSIQHSGSAGAGFAPGAIAILDQAVNATGTQVVINNSGTIESAADAAIRAIQGANGSLEVNNSGTINGNILHFGGLSALIDNSGLIDGNISLSQGDDTLIFRGVDADFTGTASGGDGINTLRFIDASGLTLTSTQLISEFSTIELLSGSLALNNAAFQSFNSAGTFTTAAGTTLSLAGAANGIYFDPGGVFTHAGTLEVAADGRLTLSAGLGNAFDFAALDGSTVRFVLDTVAGSSQFSGQIRATNILFDQGSQIDLDVRTAGVLVNGRTFDVAIATGTLTDDSGAVTDNSILFDFTKEVIGGNTLRITMEQLLSIADTINPADPNSAALANAVQSLIDSNTPAGDNISTVMGGFSTAETLGAAVQDLAPDSSNLAALFGLETLEPLLASVRDRALHDPSAERGTTLWVSGGSLGQDLDASGSLSGFSADGRHFTLGGEFRGDTGWAFGLGYDRVDGDGRTDGAHLGAADFETDRAFAYAFVPAGKWQLSATAGIGQGEVVSQRRIPVLSEIARGKTNMDSRFARVEAGYAIGGGNFTVTPVAGLQFANITLDAWTETGSDAALRYGKRDISSKRGDIGVTLDWGGEAGSPWGFTSSLRYVSEFGEVDDPITAQFAAGGDAFSYQVNAPDDSGTEFGAGARLRLGEGAALSVGYRGHFSDGSDRHAGLISLAYDF